MPLLCWTEPIDRELKEPMQTPSTKAGLDHTDGPGGGEAGDGGNSKGQPTSKAYVAPLLRRYGTEGP